MLLFVLLTSACSTLPRSGLDDDASEARYHERRVILARLHGWSLQGRLAISDENDGGSGALRWSHSDSGSRLDFHGALGRGAWSLESDNDSARLQMADGSRFTADSVRELVESQLGWHIPVDQLSWWVLGVEAPGSIERRSIDESGELNELKQSGWEIEFSRYREQDGVLLPGRMIARQDDKTVKLAIREWDLVIAGGN